MMCKDFVRRNYYAQIIARLPAFQTVSSLKRRIKETAQSAVQLLNFENYNPSIDTQIVSALCESIEPIRRA